MICVVKLIDGVLKKGDRIYAHSSKREYDVSELGILFGGVRVGVNALYAGQVGYIIGGMKTTKEARVGDTFSMKSQNVESLEGFQPAKPMVWAGVYPLDSSNLENLTDAINK